MFQYIEDFTKRPFDSEMNMTRWILFILFIIIVAGLWASVISLITKGLE